MADDADPIPSATLTLAAAVDRACDRFEAAWGAGGRPRIEDYLGAVEAPDVPFLLRELIASELEHRAALGECPGAGEYEERFPGHASLIAGVFAATVLTAPRPQPVPSATPTPADQVTAPRYRVVRSHAQGAMGVVFLARDRELPREVALKLIQASLADDPGARARFVREAEITGALEHPGIVPVYGLGAYQDGRPYYAMRFIRGDSLGDAIAAFHADPALKADPGARALALGKLLRRFLDVCNAIDYAHSRGVLHRDIKPGNVVVGRYGETLVVDWGLAKPLGRPESVPSGGEPAPLALASGSSETLPGTAVGTPAFMSPEQADGEVDRVGPRSDVYSLGATLYALLTGRAPFRGELYAVLRQVSKGAFPTLRRVDPTIDRALEAVCLRAMARKPVDRYDSPRALAEDVECWLADEPVRAWREPFARRARRWARRHRTGITAAAAALVVALAASTALAVFQVNAARRERFLSGKESEAKAVAVARLGQVEKANALLGDIFQDLDPNAEDKEGRPLRLILGDRLGRAAAALDAGAIGDPLTLARLQRILGTTQANLGNPAEAVPLLTHASRSLAGLLGVNHSETLLCDASLITAELSVGDKAEAVKNFEALLGRFEAAYGPDDPRTVQCRANLAASYVVAARPADAVPLLEVILKRLEADRTPGPVSPLAVRVNLAGAYLATLRVADAVKTLDQSTLKAYEAALGPAHPNTSACRAMLATVLIAAGRSPEAIALYEADVKTSEQRLGHTHPRTLMARNLLAMAYQNAGRVDEAVSLFEANLKPFEWTLGPDHPATQLTRTRLAQAYRSLGRSGDAVPLLEAGLRSSEATLGPDHPESMACRAALVEAYAAAGRSPEAIPLLDAGLKALEAKLGARDAQAVNCRARLAHSLAAAGRAAEAVLLFETNLATLESQGGPDQPQAVLCRAELAETYTTAGRPGEAVRLHEAALLRAEAKLGPDDPTSRVIRDDLATAYLNACRPDDAIRVRDETLRRMETKLGPENPETVACRADLLATYVAAGRPDEAVRAREASLRLLEATLGPEDPATLSARSDLSWTLIQAGRPADAARLSARWLKREEAAFGANHPATMNGRLDHALCLAFLGEGVDAVKQIEATLALARATFGPDNPVSDAGESIASGVYELTGQFAKLEPLAREQLRRCRAELGADNPQTAAAQDALGYCLVRIEQWSDAEGVLRDCLKFRESNEPGAWATYFTRSSLGAALAGLGRFAQAEPLLLSGYSGVKARERTMLPTERASRVGEAAERIVRLYRAWGKPALADAWAVQLGLATLPDDVFAPTPTP